MGTIYLILYRRKRFSYLNVPVIPLKNGIMTKRVMALKYFTFDVASFLWFICKVLPEINGNSYSAGFQ